MASLPNVASEIIFTEDIVGKKTWVHAKINFEEKKTVSKHIGF